MGRMQLLDFVQKNPDAVVTAIVTIAGWFGLSRWRKGREATANEVDRWAAAAVAAVQGVIASGKLGADHQAIAAKAVQIFRELAAGAGIVLTPANELRAQSIMVEGLNTAAVAARAARSFGLVSEGVAKSAQDVAAGASADLLGGAANKLLHNLRRLSTVKGGGIEGLK